MDRERSVIACPKFFQTFTTIAVQRLIVPDALAEEQSPDTIDMQNPLGDQRFALSAKAAAILFLGRRHPNHRANAWFPPLVSHQGGLPRDWGRELPPNWWTALLSSEGSGKVSNGPGTASFYG